VVTRQRISDERAFFVNVSAAFQKTVPDGTDADLQAVIGRAPACPATHRLSPSRAFPKRIRAFQGKTPNPRAEYARDAIPLRFARPFGHPFPSLRRGDVPLQPALPHVREAIRP